ncbi:B3 domain-containing transcription factor VRN1 [Spinacia oleracea]|uniref:B3 domain-containing transcription factor VRN1 n=1 Tax=Spinacia oleracea TaxID=3562 RepID=A0A9R0JRS6_SPIOL|nr:B3 domain-containing transcription factor VRN1-like [Spinacia oleracea]
METYFYKIMVCPSTQTKELKIPKEYVTKYGKQFAKSDVKLQVSDGSVWRVKVLKENDKVRLTKGWEKIVETYSLKYGNFLLFKFDKRDSMFHLTIFDPPGYEIEFDQQLVQISSESEQMEIDHITDYDDDIVSSDIYEEGDSVDLDEMNVRKRYEAFEPKNPHFKLVMTPNTVSKGYRISVPIKHVREHLKPWNRELILKAGGREKRFHVKLLMYPNNNQAPLGRGWKLFVWENALRVGDGCVFELVCPQTHEYIVTIFRLPRAVA